MKPVLGRILALAGATVAAVAAWVAAAALRPEFGILAATALAAFLAVGYVLLAVADRDGGAGGAARRRRRLGWLIAGAALYMTAAHLAVGKAPARWTEDLPPWPAAEFWTLPDGAALAYHHTPATGEARGPPVILVHGGPGIPVLPAVASHGTRPLDALAAEGYPVYYYDQRGAGHSNRLDLRRGETYTVAGHVADLEAVRIALGADRIVPVGHGWGATLATQYLLTHPDRVERLVLLAPEPAWYPAYDDMVNPAARARLTEVQASALALLQRPPPRLVIGRLTATTSRRAAHGLVADWEADQWWTDATREAWRLGQPNLTCSADAATRVPPPAGLGFFAYSYTLADALRLPDPRPALARQETPTLIVRGLCDYVRWEVAYEYLQLMPGARYVSLPAGGHLLWIEQQELLDRVLVPFLAGDVVPLSYYHPGREAPAAR